MNGPPSRRNVLGYLGASSLNLIAGCGGRTTDNETANKSPNQGVTSPTEQTEHNTDHETTETESPNSAGHQPSTFTRVSALDPGASEGILSDVTNTDTSVVFSGHLGGDAALVSIGEGSNVEWIQKYQEWRDFSSRYRFPGISVSAASDGGFLIGAQPKERDDTIVASKTNQRGEIEWSRTFEEHTPASAWLVELGGGGYVCAWTDVGVHIRNTTVLRFNEGESDPRWKRTYDEFDLDQITTTPEGGCYLSGSGLQTGFWMANLREDGEERWRYTTQNFDYYSGRPVEEGYLLWGTVSKNARQAGTRVRRLDANRQTVWTKSYDQPKSITTSAVQTDNGSVLLFSEGDGGFWVSKISESGDMDGARKIKIAEDQKVRPLAAIEDGDQYHVSGEYEENDSTDGWLSSISKF